MRESIFLRNAGALILAVILALTPASLVSCGIKRDDGISVVATNFALYDFARAVCGERANVTMLLAPGAESHDFEATLSEIAKIAEAELFVYVGGESEEWTKDVFEAVESVGERVNSLRTIDLVETLVEGKGHSSHDGHDHDSHEVDEHIWTSIPNAVTIIGEIARRMSEISPENSEYFENRASEYISELEQIDSEILSLVNSAERRTIIVADRFPLRYFAERYGIEYYAAFDGCSSDTEPTLAMVNFLVERVRDAGGVIFVMESGVGACAEAVSRETGAEILTLHSAHNVSREELETGVTYADLMRQNLDVLSRGWSE